MRTQSLAVACALAALAAIPAAQAQDIGITNPNVATPTQMYFHLLDIQDFPINTQIPDDAWTEEVTYGGTTSTLTCVEPAGNTGGLENEYHTYRGYSSPSYVEYDFIENGKPRTHPERGISYDAVFDQQAPFFVYWYLRTTTATPDPIGATIDNQAPLPVPGVVVRATMRAGDAISVDDKAYDSGPLIAQGQTAPVVLAPPPAGVQNMPPASGASTEVTYVGNTQIGHVYEFKIPMQPETDKIPRATGYNLRIDAFVDNPACNSPGEAGYFMPNLVSAFSGADHRPRMELSIMNPIRLEYLHPQFVGDDLVVHTSMNSAWGNYDVKEETIKVAITGPSPAPSLARAAIVQRTHEHYHHQEAVDVTYVWPYKLDRALNGLYTVNVEFQNDQGTATALGTAQFEIGKGIVIGCGGIQESAQKLSDDCAKDVQKDGAGPAKESPGLELVGLLGILAGAIAIARRRQA